MDSENCGVKKKKKYESKLKGVTYGTRVTCPPLEDSIAGIFLLVVAKPWKLDLASLFGRHETLAAVEEVHIAELLGSPYHYRRPKVLGYAESGISGLVQFAAAGLVFEIFKAAHDVEDVRLLLDSGFKKREIDEDCLCEIGLMLVFVVFYGLKTAVWRRFLKWEVS